jgi:hypothetical protein
MPRGKVAEFDYYEFTKLLRRATDGGARIDKGDSRWAEEEGCLRLIAI